MKRAWWFGLCLLCACSSGNKYVPPAPSGNQDMDSDSGPAANGGKGGKGGKGGGGGSGGSNLDAGIDAAAQDSGAPDPLAPMIMFTAPSPAGDPNDDEVITSSSLKVDCKAIQSTMPLAAAIDKTMVKITLEQPGDPTKTIAPQVDALGGNEYEAVFDLAMLPNGPLRFHCSARDLASTPHTGSATLDTFLDLGPTITVNQPSRMIYALKAPVPIEFRVDKSPLNDDDDEADVDQVKLVVAGLVFDAPESKTTPGLYQTSVDFDDMALFKQTPTNAQVVISATDHRSPTAPTREARLDLVIDSTGPTITINAPVDGSIRRGNVAIDVNVSDPSGVNVSTLVAKVNNDTYKDWTATAPKYVLTFDTRKYPNTLTQLTITVVAEDQVGNEASRSIALKLDNLPPIVSLDPPHIQEWHNVNDVLYCSEFFDPVGSSAADDLDTVDNTRRYRALVEDQTNAPIRGPNDPPAHLYLAGTDRSSVELFMQPDLGLPLLIDTNADGVCDQVNYEALPIAQKPLRQQLGAVNQTGTAWYLKQPKGTSGCRQPTDSTDPIPPDQQPKEPDPVCHATEMERVIPGRIEGKPPAVYAIRPTNGGDGECDGESWPLMTLAHEGWNCVAARAQDTIGNVGVSQPLRICFHDPTMTSSVPDCVSDKSSPPSCTDGCTISAAQQFSYTADPYSWYWP
jgi:hypothetical protein